MPTILVVEDNDVNIELFKDALAFHKYDFLIAENGEKGYVMKLELSR